MGINGPLDIMHDPIYRAMDLYEVKDKKDCFEKVLIMSNAWIDRMREK